MPVFTVTSSRWWSSGLAQSCPARLMRGSGQAAAANASLFVSYTYGSDFRGITSLTYVLTTSNVAETKQAVSRVPVECRY
jgi:hypothetical protein